MYHVRQIGLRVRNLRDSVCQEKTHNPVFAYSNAGDNRCLVSSLIRKVSSRRRKCVVYKNNINFAEVYREKTKEEK